MAKPGDFYVNALDFFGTLLPGAITVGTLTFLNVPNELPSDVRGALDSDFSRIAAFVILAYVVGQAANSVGSLILDVLYDQLYDPKHGLLSKPVLAAEAEASWLERTFGIYDRGTDDRRLRLRDELKSLVQGPVKGAVPVPGAIKGVYQTVRAYLKIVSPETFADLEKLEGEQKFFRALTIGMIALTLLPGQQSVHGSGLAALLVVSLLMFLRYISVRRKTVERAYAYFSLRAAFRGSAERPAEQGRRGEHGYGRQQTSEEQGPADAA